MTNRTCFVGQENARYIENQVRTGYDRVRNFCAGFMEDFLLPSICGCGGFISETYLMHDSDFDNCEESEIGSHTEMTLTPAELDESVSLGKGSSPVTLPNGPYHDVNQGEDCSAPLRISDAISEEVTRCDYLKKEKEIRKDYYSDACFAVSSVYRCASDRVTDDTGILVLPSVYFFSTADVIGILVLPCFHVLQTVDVILILVFFFL